MTSTSRFYSVNAIGYTGKILATLASLNNCLENFLPRREKNKLEDAFPSEMLANEEVMNMLESNVVD